MSDFTQADAMADEARGGEWARDEAAGTGDRPRGFWGLHCPACGEDGACITLDLDDCAVFRCRECEAELSVEDVEDFVAKADAWRRVLAWVATAPVRQE